MALGAYFSTRWVRNADYFAPYCTRFVKKYQPGWFTNNLLELSIELYRLFSTAKRSNDKKIYEKANKKRNEVKTLISNARSSYYINKIDQYSGNPKKFWWEINNQHSKGKEMTRKLQMW